MASNDNEKQRQKLGKILLDAREVAKLTQKQVAEASGVHTNFYARVERGEENPSFEKLQSIMQVLKIKSIDLL